jgi:hypothetical protein
LDSIIYEPFLIYFSGVTSGSLFIYTHLGGGRELRKFNFDQQKIPKKGTDFIGLSTNHEVKEKKQVLECIFCLKL